MDAAGFQAVALNYRGVEHLPCPGLASYIL